MAPKAAQRVPLSGERAPDVTLTTTTGETVSLASLLERGHVLIAFFPLAFSSVCTTEMCSFTEDFDQFATRGVTVVPISVDSKYALREFKAKHGMKTELYSDFKREAAKAFGVLLEAQQFANRAYFLIDHEGVIRWSHVEDTPGTRRDNRELLEHIAALP